jgi:PKD repeat protein
MAKLQVVLQDFAIVDVVHEFFMISNGVGELSRAHIRHNSNVSAELLHLEASHVATLGHSSTYNVTDAIRLKSPEAEASSIFRDTVIHTNTLEVSSGVVTRIGARVEVNADTVHLHGLECKLPNNAQINAPNKIGNCFSGEHPTARMTTSNLRGQGDLEVMFDVSRTDSGPSDFDFATWQFAPNLPLIQVTNPETSYHYTMPGVYRMEFIVWNQAGLRDSLRRRIDVDEVDHPLAPRVSYRYSIDPDDPNEVRFELLARPSFGAHIVAAKYIVDDDYEFVASGTAYKSATTHQFEQEKNYRVKVIAMDNFGRTASYERTINLALSAHPPVIDVEIHQVAPRTLYVDLHRSFGVHSRLGSGRVVWGDGSRTDLSSLFVGHTYNEAGVYEVRVRLEDEDGRARAQVFLVDVTDDNGVTVRPTANFEVEELEFAQAFRLYVDQSGTPNGSIVSALWSFGDGTTGQGLEVVHYYEPGVYNVSLQITDSAGMTDTQTQQVVVHGGSPLVAHSDCTHFGLTLYCEWFALDAKKNLTSVVIDWGDGNQSPQPILNSEFEIYRDISHTYSGPGEYTITITAISNGLISATSTLHYDLRAQADYDLDISINCSEPYSDLELYVHRSLCLASLSGEDSNLISSYRWLVPGQSPVEDNIIDLEYLPNIETSISFVVTMQDGGELVKTHLLPERPLSFPEGHFDIDCESTDLTLSCSLANADNLEVLWGADGVPYETSSLLIYYTEPKLVDLEVILSFQGRVVYSEVEEVQVVENSSQLLLGDLLCQRLTLFATRCWYSEDYEQNTEFAWKVNGENIVGDHEDSSFIAIDHDGFGTDTIELLVSNFYFTKNLSTQIEIDYNPPFAQFTYNLQTDGLVYLDATDSLENDRHVQLFSWTRVSDGELLAEVGLPAFSIEADRVRNEVIRLTVIDDLEAESSFELIIDIDNNFIVPIAEIEFIQPRGRADRLVTLSGLDSIDPNGHTLSYKWTVQGEEYHDPEVQLNFDEPGTYEVELMVTNQAGLFSVDYRTLIIEPFTVTESWPSYFSPWQGLGLYLENFDPNDPPIVTINDQNIPVELLADSLYGTFIPYAEENDEIMIVVHLDEYTLVHHGAIEERVYHDNPLEEIISYFDEQKSALMELSNDIPELSLYAQEIEELLQEFFSVFEDQDDPEVYEFTQLVHYYLEKYKPSDIATETSFHVPHNSLWENGLDLLFPKAHAQRLQSELLAIATSCNTKLGISDWVSNIGTAIIISTNAATVVSLVATAPTIVGPAATLTASALTITLVNFTASLVRVVLGYNMLASCIDEVRFAYPERAEQLELSVNTSETKNVDGEVLPLMRALESYRVNIQVPLAHFSQIGFGDNAYSSDLHERMRNTLSVYNSPSVTGMFENALVMGQVLLSIGNLPSLAVNVAYAFISVINDFGGRNHYDKSLQDLTQNHPINGSSFETMIIDSETPITAHRASNITITSPTSGEISAFNSGAYDAKFRVQAVVDSQVLGRGGIEVSSGQEYAAEPVCARERFRHHKNNKGYGFVSYRSIVSPSVHVGSESRICGNSNVRGNVNISGRTTITDSLITNHTTCPTHIHDSVLENNSRLYGRINAHDIYSKGAVVISDSACLKNNQSSDLEWSVYRSIFLTNIALYESARLELIENDSGINTLNISSSHLKGHINNATIINSSINASFFMISTRTRHQEITNSNIFARQFSLQGRSIANSSIGIGNSDFHFNGPIDIENSNIFTTGNRNSRILGPYRIVDSYLSAASLSLHGEGSQSEPDRIINSYLYSPEHLTVEDSRIVNFEIATTSSRIMGARITGGVFEDSRPRIIETQIGEKLTINDLHYNSRIRNTKIGDSVTLGGHLHTYGSTIASGVSINGRSQIYDSTLNSGATIFESYVRNARTNRAIFDSALFFSGKKIVPIFENKTRNICTDQNIDAVESVYDEEGVLIWSNPCYNPQEPGTGLSYFWFEDDD